jgi:CRP-like cAMP-binding protein
LANGSTLGHQDNRLLAAIPRETLEVMARELRLISLVQGQPIYEPGAPIEDIYFPQSGMLAMLVVGKNGEATEVGTIGRDGALGLHGALGKRLSFTRATTQIAGKFSTIRTTVFGQLAEEHAALRDLVAR